MAAAFETGGQKGFQNFQHQPFADHALAEREHIRVVMQSRIFCGIGIVAVRTAYSLDLIRRNRNADARTADHYAAIARSVCNGFRRGKREIGIIAGTRLVRTEIDDFISVRMQIIDCRPL